MPAQLTSYGRKQNIKVVLLNASDRNASSPRNSSKSSVNAAYAAIVAHTVAKHTIVKGLIEFFSQLRAIIRMRRSL